MAHFLKVSGGRIMDGDRPFYLRGVNLGGWLMPEGYIMHAPNRGYRYFRADFEKAHGDGELRAFERSFRSHFIVEEDLRRISLLGCNSVRLPFHYGLVEESPYVYSLEGVGYIDRAILWAKKYGMRVILDMHAVPGAQNHDWHSDSDGQARFWTNKVFQHRAAALWAFLAERYKDEKAVAGYDILNETVLQDPKPLNAYYQAAIKAIRLADRDHIIFVEGNRWAQDIECLDEFEDDNLVLGIHFYEPLEFTFNFIPGLSYPLGKGKGRWDRAFMRKRLGTFVETAQKRGRPLWCGEFGVNARGGLYQEDVWLKDVLAGFNANGIHWHYWTWKAMKNYMFPDGVYSYFPNDPWVNRPGPVSGWDTWPVEWTKNKKKMISSWDIKMFDENKAITAALKSGLR
jgi:endoglucanase